MLHGIVYGDVDDFANQVMPEKDLDQATLLWDFSCEAWSFFATGANCQELYLTPRYGNFDIILGPFLACCPALQHHMHLTRAG